MVHIGKTDTANRNNDKNSFDVSDLLKMDLFVDHQMLKFRLQYRSSFDYLQSEEHLVTNMRNLSDIVIC